MFMGGIHSNLIICVVWRMCYIFWAGGGREGALKNIWSLCGASLFKLRKQRPPMCYTSHVVRGAGQGGGSPDLPQTHTWNLDLSHKIPAGKWKRARRSSSEQLVHLPHTASTDSVYHSVPLLTATLFFLLHFPRSFPLGQAGLGLIVLYMTDTEWGLALIQGRPCKLLHGFFPPSLLMSGGDIFDKNHPRQSFGWRVMCVQRQNSKHDTQKCFIFSHL